MAEFKLPSGRVVETREPTWGEEVHAISTGLADPESFTWAKFAVVVPGLSLEEIKALNRKDGRALMEEVNQKKPKSLSQMAHRRSPRGTGRRSFGSAATPRMASLWRALG